MQSHTFDISEADVSTRVGVAIDVVRQQREALVEGQHYRMSGRRLIFSQAGLEFIAEKLAASSKAVEHLPPAPLIVDLVVWRTVKHGLKNPRIIEAYPSDLDPGAALSIEQLVRVCVRTNENYWRGQPIKGREISPGLYEHWDPVQQCQARPPKMKGKA